ncbi:MAG: tetratricopeptide repeat protein [Pseudomonadota bacterium]
MRGLHALVLILSTLVPGSQMLAETNTTADTVAGRAAAAFAGSDWETASRLYQTLARTHPADADIWLRLGLSTLNANQDPLLAIEAFDQALALGAPTAQSYFGIARAYARQSDADGVLRSLLAIAEGGTSLGVVRRISDANEFDFLRDNNAFADVVQRLTPCATDEYRQFDFWLGNWEVSGQDGTLLGNNLVESALDGCMLTENWTSVSGFKGMSINYYDASDGTWNQTFRDNTGNVSGWPDLKGGIRQGAMVLVTGDDASPRTRWTWRRLSAGRVQQTAESSNDAGETWTVVWDAIYSKIPD